MVMEFIGMTKLKKQAYEILRSVFDDMMVYVIGSNGGCLYDTKIQR